MVVGGVTQRLALADELEPGGDHLCLDRGRLDAVQRVGGGDSGARGAGVIDHDISATGPQQVENALVDRRERLLAAGIGDVMIILDRPEQIDRRVAGGMLPA